MTRTRIPYHRHATVQKLSERHRERMRRRPSDLDVEEVYPFALPTAWADIDQARDAVADVEAGIAAMDERAALRRAGRRIGRALLWLVWPPSWSRWVMIAVVMACLAAQLVPTR